MSYELCRIDKVCQDLKEYRIDSVKLLNSNFRDQFNTIDNIMTVGLNINNLIVKIYKNELHKE